MVARMAASVMFSCCSFREGLRARFLKATIAEIMIHQRLAGVMAGQWPEIKIVLKIIWEDKKEIFKPNQANTGKLSPEVIERHVGECDNYIYNLHLESRNNNILTEIIMRRQYSAVGGISHGNVKSAAKR